jgi:hypothetical protein
MGFDESAAARQNRLASAMPVNLRQAVLYFSKSRILTRQYFEEHKAKPGAAGTRKGCQKRVFGFEPKMPGPHPGNANFASCGFGSNSSECLHHKCIFLKVYFLNSTDAEHLSCSNEELLEMAFTLKKQVFLLAVSCGTISFLT